MCPEIKIEDDVDYNCCCYCAEQFKSAELRDKHEVQCHMGPQLQVLLPIAEFQNAWILSGTYKNVNSGNQASSQLIKNEQDKCKDFSELEYRSRVEQSNEGIGEGCNVKSDHQMQARKAKQSAARHRKYNCSVCDYRSLTKDLLEKHMLQHGVITGRYTNFKYKCKHCWYITHHQGGLLYHCRVKHGKHKTEYNCSICQYKSDRKARLDRHMLSHGIVVTDRFPKMLKCEQCQYKTYTIQQLNAHVKIHNPANMNYKCETCNYKTFTKKGLNRHMMTHNKDKPEIYLKCDQCDYKTYRADTLKRHTLKHNKAKIENMKKCEHCNYETYSKDCLKSHLFTHSRDKNNEQHKCNQCEYKSYRIQLLRKHISVHHKPRIRIKCQQCNYTTLDKQCLKTHMLIHAIEGVNKVYRCEQCSYKTFRKAALYMHMRRHDVMNDPSKWNYNCDYCTYKIFRKDMLNAHLRKKHPIRLYCYMCVYSTYKKRHLRAHVVRHRKTALNKSGKGKKP
nr:unnamed protein product [Callosobruchus analis]